MKRESSHAEKNYHSYYDLIVQAKDYRKEAGFVDSLIRKHQASARELLDVGCGTGSHDFVFAEKGYTVHGVEQNERLLAGANVRLSKAAKKIRTAMTFGLADARTMNLKRQFDVVIAMYNVLGYMTANEDATAFLSAIKRHLRPGGLFICDCWYGPAFIGQPPRVRIRRGGDSAKSVLHIAEPVLVDAENKVAVDYTLIVRDKKSECACEFSEKAAYRFFFMPELKLLFGSAGLTIVETMEFMTGKKVECATREICVVACNSGK